MTMTVGNFLELPVTKEFKIITGHDHLHRTMKNVEILDFEFLEGFENTRQIMFTEGSLVLTSLLFAKNQPHLLIRMVDELVRCKVSALAFKPVIYQQLPFEVIKYATEKTLPILQFGGDEFFEDIIFQAMDYRNKIAHTDFLQTTITYLIENEVTQEQLQTLLKQINKPFEEYVHIICLKGNRKTTENLFRFEPFLRTGLICRYQGRILIVMTNSTNDYAINTRMKELLALFDFHEPPVYIGESEILKTATHFQIALKQAYYASIFAEIYHIENCRYEKLTTEKLLIELIHNQPNFVENYIATYIEPLNQAEHQLIETAIDYVQLQGNIKAIANKQYCHANTIRYRLNKMRILTTTELSEWSFYEQLSIAIKLYLVIQQIEKDTSL